VCLPRLWQPCSLMLLCSPVLPPSSEIPPALSPFQAPPELEHFRRVCALEEGAEAPRVHRCVGSRAVATCSTTGNGGNSSKQQFIMLQTPYVKLSSAATKARNLQQAAAEQLQTTATPSAT
jgi:hypothetical protein